MNHTRWKTARERQLHEGDEPAAVSAARWEIKLAFDLGQAVHDRRTALGFTQSELAARAGMTSRRSPSSNSAAPFPPCRCRPALPRRSIPP
jgi:hypothetical protein